MTLWISLTVMGLMAVLFVAYPLYRNSKSFTPAIAIAVLLVSAFWGFLQVIGLLLIILPLMVILVFF